jgi:hypothetical protein
MLTLCEVVFCLLYGVMFEYLYHRFLLHGPFWKNHAAHHEDPEGPVFFAKTLGGFFKALAIVGLNSLVIGWAMGNYLVPLVSFVFYYIVLLEGAHALIHKYHLSKHHMTHHADLKQGNFNVWIDLGDRFFGTKI